MMQASGQDVKDLAFIEVICYSSKYIIIIIRVSQRGVAAEFSLTN